MVSPLEYGLAITDLVSNNAFGYERVKSASPALYQKLLAHWQDCGISRSVRPYRLNRHIVFCPVCKTRLGSLSGTNLEQYLTNDYLEIVTVGVVGFGSFGKFFAKHLALEFDVSAWDIIDHQEAAESVGVTWEGFEQTAKKDLLILAVPLPALESVLQRLRGLAQPQTLVVDVCSVKQEPMRLMQKHLPNNRTLGIHPLFGPQSAKEGLAGHKVVVCPSRPPSPKEICFREFLVKRWGLRVVELGAERHDQQMAVVQGLTHFIARALCEMGVAGSEFSTAAFEHLCGCIKLLGGDSWELFQTIQQGNPFAADVRKRFMEQLEMLERRISK